MIDWDRSNSICKHGDLTYTDWQTIIAQIDWMECVNAYDGQGSWYCRVIISRVAQLGFKWLPIFSTAKLWYLLYNVLVNISQFIIAHICVVSLINWLHFRLSGLVLSYQRPGDSLNLSHPHLIFVLVLTNFIVVHLNTSDVSLMHDPMFGRESKTSQTCDGSNP